MVWVIRINTCICQANVPDVIPNWFGAPAVKLESPARDLFHARACKSKTGTMRCYDHQGGIYTGKAGRIFE